MLSHTYPRLLDALSYFGRQTWVILIGGYPKRPFYYDTLFNDSHFLSRFLALPAEIRHQVLTETLNKDTFKQLFQLNLRKVRDLGPKFVMELYFDAILNEVKRLHPVIYEHMILVCKNWRQQRFMAVESRVEMVVQYIDHCRTIKELKEEEEASQADLAKLYARASIDLRCWSDQNWLATKEKLFDRVLEIHLVCTRSYAIIKHGTGQEKTLKSLQEALPKARVPPRQAGALMLEAQMEEKFWDWIFEDWDVQVEPNYFMRRMIDLGRQRCLRGSAWKSYKRSD